MFENNDNELDVLLNRVKEFIGSNKDAAVARELSVSRSNIPTWRKRGTAPYRELVSWAYEKGISMDWLFYGKPPMMIDDAAEELEIDEFDSFDPEALEIAIECVELYISELALKVPPAKKAKVIRMLYPLIRDDEDNEVPDNVIDLLQLASEAEEEEKTNEQKEKVVDSDEGTRGRKISID